MTKGLDGQDAYYVGNIVKYLYRYPMKGTAHKDLLKARQYHYESGSPGRRKGKRECVMRVTSIGGGVILQNDRKLVISVGSSRSSKNWVQTEMMWSEFIDRLRMPQRRRERYEENQ